MKQITKTYQISQRSEIELKQNLVNETKKFLKIEYKKYCFEQKKSGMLMSCHQSE